MGGGSEEGDADRRPSSSSSSTPPTSSSCGCRLWKRASDDDAASDASTSPIGVVGSVLARSAPSSSALVSENSAPGEAEKGLRRSSEEEEGGGEEGTGVKSEVEREMKGRKRLKRMEGRGDGG